MDALFLPPAFEDLLPYSSWALETERERNDRRLASNFIEIKDFYDAFVPRAEAAIAYLDGIGLDALAGPDRNLFNLLMALAEVTPAVEYYQGPVVAGGFDSRRMVAIER